MKKIFSLMLVICLALGSLVGCGAKKNSDESAKKEQTKSVAKNQTENKQKKVIAGTLGVMEIFNALDVKISGIPKTSRKLPDGLDNLPKIGLPMNPDVELIKSLKADLIVTDKSLQASLEKKFNNQNIKSEFLDCSGYDAFVSTIERLGKEFGKEDKANELVKDMKKRESEVKKSIEGKPSPKVMIIFGTPESFMLATDKSYVGNLVTKCGGVNITSELKNVHAPYVPFSIEKAVKLNPDIVLRLTHANPEVSKKMFDKEFKDNNVWKALKAVKNEKVYDLDNKYFGVTANIRCIDALEKMSELLYK